MRVRKKPFIFFEQRENQPILIFFGIQRPEENFTVHAPESYKLSYTALTNYCRTHYLGVQNSYFQPRFDSNFDETTISTGAVNEKRS